MGDAAVGAGKEDDAIPDALDTARRFFEAYRTVGVETRDGKQIANFYHVPCLTLRSDGSFVWLDTMDGAAQFFQTVVESFYRQGWESFVFKDLVANPLRTVSPVGEVFLKRRLRTFTASTGLNSVS